jgi:hypothetical protein
VEQADPAIARNHAIAEIEQLAAEQPDIDALAADVLRLADEIYNHPLNVLARQHAGAKARLEGATAVRDARLAAARSKLCRVAPDEIPRSIAALERAWDYQRNRAGEHSPRKVWREVRDNMALLRRVQRDAAELRTAPISADEALRQLKTLMDSVGVPIPPPPQNIPAKIRFNEE